jgi:hypothetical protein
VKQAHEDLQRRIAALRTRFVDVGARAAAAARALAATTPPPERLLQDLTALGAEFAVLRAAVLEEAASLARPPAASSVSRIRDLESVTASVIAAEEERARQAAWDVARENAAGVLDRVQILIHREDRDFPALAECQAKARELLAATSGPSPADIDRETAALEARLRPYIALVTLAEGWNRLDDERCAALQDEIAERLGRPLALAALRGKLGRQGEIVATPEPAPEPSPAPAPEPQEPSPAGLFTAAASTTEQIAAAVAPPPVVEPPPPVVEPPPPVVEPLPPVVEPPPMPEAPPDEPPAPPDPPPTPLARGVLPPSLDEPWATSPGADTQGEVEIRLSADEVHVETSEERRARETLLERLASKNAQWWIRARTSFKALAARDVPAANAARDALEKFPYLLSVPLQGSVEYAGGRLAEGYAILLQRIEKEEPGFVESALTRLNPQFTTGGKTDSYPLGQELYLYVVAQGRLYKTYPEFLKDVLGHVLPEPGVWLQGTITESEDATHVVTNGSTPGSTAEGSRRLTSAGDRAAAQTFAVSTGPLTTRVFTVQADTLKQPVDVEIKLAENDTPSDKAWIVPTPASGRPDFRRHRAGGTTIESLGGDCRAVLIAVFNSDPNADKRYDLSITLKRKTPAGKPDTPLASRKPSPFAPRR